jgi:hypothetical protein
MELFRYLNVNGRKIGLQSFEIASRRAAMLSGKVFLNKLREFTPRNFCYTTLIRNVEDN